MIRGYYLLYFNSTFVRAVRCKSAAPAVHLETCFLYSCLFLRWRFTGFPLPSRSPSAFQQRRLFLVSCILTLYFLVACILESCLLYSCPLYLISCFLFYHLLKSISYHYKSIKTYHFFYSSQQL